MRVAPKIVLTEGERVELTKLTQSRLTSVRLAQRARIILLAANGLQNQEIAEEMCVGRILVARWRGRYAEMRWTGIERDLPRGAPPKKVDIARLVELTTQSKPEAATHWSTRKMAKELGVHSSSVSRHWRAAGLKPHIVRGFKISRDPNFVEKLEDIVGLYLSPPEHALVFNALRYSDATGQSPEVRLQRTGDGGITIEVRDYGPGVPESQLSQLAQAFYRPDSARTRAAGGVGLGLYPCRLIAQAHGGTFEVRNANPGLSVLVTLPA